MSSTRQRWPSHIDYCICNHKYTDHDAEEKCEIVGCSCKQFVKYVDRGPECERDDD